MATQRDINCDICENQSITTPAVKWCSECDEGFCCQCLTFHKHAKSTRSHETINVDDYKKLPPFILNIKQHCDEHGIKFQIYCKFHECLCCPVCAVTYHKNCEDQLPVGDVMGNARSSATLFDIKERLQNLRKYFKLSSEEKYQNKQEIIKQSGHILKDIHDTRKYISDYFDKLEQVVIEEVSAVKVDIENKIDETTENIKIKEAKIEQLEKSIDEIEQHATDVQVFLGTKVLEKETQGIEKAFQDFQASGSLEKHTIIFERNSEISSLLSNIHCLGTVIMGHCSSDVKLKSVNVKQVQVNSGKTLPFESIDLELIKEMKYDTTGTFGNTMMSNGDIIVTDRYNKNIKIWKKGPSTHVSNPTSIINRLMRPYDLTAINDHTIAVTSVDCSIMIIDLTSQIVKRTINTDGPVHGIAYSDGKLIYSSLNSGLNMLNLDNDVITTLNIGRKDYDIYIAIQNNRIYCADDTTSSVICYNSDFTTAFTYKTADLKDCRGIAVDDNLNIYVACLVGHIVIISSDRETHKSVSLKGLDQPRTIYVDETRRYLLVCGQYGPVHVYSISQ